MDGGFLSQLYHIARSEYTSVGFHPETREDLLYNNSAKTQATSRPPSKFNPQIKNDPLATIIGLLHNL
jgi:hypothetical protein